MVKRVKKIAKQLKGDFKQADTMSDGPTMGNPGKGGKRMKAMREKRLSKASV
jgi:hypothetical protein